MMGDEIYPVPLFYQIMQPTRPSNLFLPDLETLILILIDMRRCFY
jgi:hypothetical protein